MKFGTMMHLKDGEAKLIRSHAKIKIISGQRVLLFLLPMFAFNPILPGLFWSFSAGGTTPCYSFI